MKKYNEWLKEEAELVSTTPIPVTPTDAATSQTVAQKAVYQADKTKLKNKAWKASKDEILTFWRSVAGNSPIQLKPIPYSHKGTTIQEDGIRITGTKEFIASILSRMKELINFENDNNKLIISYRQSPKSLIPGNKESYMFYLQIKERGQKSK
jgi:hypothetical protein